MFWQVTCRKAFLIGGFLEILPPVIYYINYDWNFIEQGFWNEERA